MSNHEISFNTNRPGSIGTKADFIYHMGPDWITIADTGTGKCSVAEDLESVLRKIEYWYQGSVAKFKIMCQDSKGFWHQVPVGRQSGCSFSFRRDRRTKSSRKVARAKVNQALAKRARP
jgi:hypothetical protein